MATTTKDLSRTLSDYHVSAGSPISFSHFSTSFLSQSTHDAMLKLHQSHIHDMEEIFANISLAAKDGFALPDLSFGGIVYIASRGEHGSGSLVPAVLTLAFRPRHHAAECARSRPSRLAARSPVLVANGAWFLIPIVTSSFMTLGPSRWPSASRCSAI